MSRCSWATHSQIEQDYHDSQWGVANFDDAYLFEMLILEGFQAGLSWRLVLERRENMRVLLDGFNWQVIKHYSTADLVALQSNPAMIRNRLKIQALPINAQAFERVREEFGRFSDYIWSFVNHTPIVNHWTSDDQRPTKTDLSDAISKDLKKRGFKFVGSTIIYSYLQAIGIIDDHLVTCDFKGGTRCNY